MLSYKKLIPDSETKTKTTKTNGKSGIFSKISKKKEIFYFL